VFPIEKYRLVRDRIMAEAVAGKECFVEPAPPSLEELQLVHSRDYLADLIRLQRTERTFLSEIVLTNGLIDSLILCAGGTLCAARMALVNAIALNIGGGFHHAFSDRAEGFCYLNDVAFAVRHLMRDGLAERVAIIDCDVHQGNGTAKIFADDKNVFTFSMHQENNYPLKEKSDIDIGLEDGTCDEEYLVYLQKVIPGIEEAFKPDLAFYLAGADPYSEDQLGGLALTIEGLRRRDDYILKSFSERNIPLAVVLAGGYASKLEETVQIHLNTCKKVVEYFKKCRNIGGGCF